jgi:hypothetical protein
MSGLGETTAVLARLRKAMKQPSTRNDHTGLIELRGFGFNPAPSGC